MSREQRAVLHNRILVRTVTETAVLLLILVSALGCFSAAPIHAQADDAKPVWIQKFDGSLDYDQSDTYLIPNLSAGDTLYIYAAGTSGDLDTFVGVGRGDVTDTIGTEISDAVRIPVSTPNRQDAITNALQRLLLANDDDGGKGYDSALSFVVPAEGSYTLLIRSSYARRTFGGYRLLVGINSPAILTGHAEPTGNPPMIERQSSQKDRAVQEITGTTPDAVSYEVFQLQKINAGDTLYVYLETADGTSQPTAMLQDFVGKQIRDESAPSGANAAHFEYTFPEAVSGYQLIILPHGTLAATGGAYRLLIGLNAPEVLTGNAAQTDRKITADPVPVYIWLTIDQISNVDQRNENFTIVGSLYLRWQYPLRAFRPVLCACATKSFLDDDFSAFTNAGASPNWP